MPNSEQRCSLADGEDWDANFMAQLVDGDDVDEAGGEDDVDEEPVSKFKSLTEALKKLDEIKLFEVI